MSVERLYDMIPFLLGAILVMLGGGFRVCYGMLRDIQNAIQGPHGHSERIAALESYPARHDQEVVHYHQTWNMERDRAWAKMTELQSDIRSLQRRQNGPDVS